MNKTNDMNSSEKDKEILHNRITTGLMIFVLTVGVGFALYYIVVGSLS